MPKKILLARISLHAYGSVQNQANTKIKTKQHTQKLYLITKSQIANMLGDEQHNSASGLPRQKLQ